MLPSLHRLHARGPSIDKHPSEKLWKEYQDARKALERFDADPPRPSGMLPMSRMMREDWLANKRNKLIDILQGARLKVEDAAFEDGVSFSVGLATDGTVLVSGFSLTGQLDRSALERELQKKLELQKKPELELELQLSQNKAAYVHALLFEGDMPFATTLDAGEYVFVQGPKKLSEYTYTLEQSATGLTFTIWGESPTVTEAKRKRAAEIDEMRKAVRRGDSSREAR